MYLRKYDFDGFGCRTPLPKVKRPLFTGLLANNEQLS